MRLSCFGLCPKTGLIESDFRQMQAFLQGVWLMIYTLSYPVFQGQADKPPILYSYPLYSRGFHLF